MRLTGKTNKTSSWLPEDTFADVIHGMFGGIPIYFESRMSLLPPLFLSHKDGGNDDSSSVGVLCCTYAWNYDFIMN